MEIEVEVLSETDLMCFFWSLCSVVGSCRLRDLIVWSHGHLISNNGRRLRGHQEHAMPKD